MCALNPEQNQLFKKFITRLCDVATEEIIPHYGVNVDVEHKSDNTPVTLADKNAEKKIRELINAEFPDHGIIGEEYGAENENNEFVWVLDPNKFVVFIFGSILFSNKSMEPKMKTTNLFGS